jgi:hypothetical protein
MSTTNTNANTAPMNFDGIHVSKGFVRGLQGQVLKLEQVQQSLIQQLEHANKLASEYHATAIMYQQSYDQALHEMDEVKQAHEREKLLRISRDHELEHFKNLLQEQLAYSSNSRSPSPRHNRDHDYDNDPVSPVSVASLSPRHFASASRLQTQGPTMLLDPETPKSENDDDNDDNDDNETEREFQMRYYYDSQSSRTTDCSGDPICHSDSD